MAIRTMHLVVIIFMLLSFMANAESDPCDLSYPIKSERVLSHPSAFDTPAIYTSYDGNRVILSVSDAIALVTSFMSEHESYLKLAKEKILKDLQELNGNVLVQQADLWPSLDGLSGEKLTIGIHVIAGYDGLFEKGLLNRKAAVQVKGSFVEKTKASYMVGKWLNAADNSQYIHKVVFANNEHVVHQKCWISNAI